jgi:hypothetical protein
VSTTVELERLADDTNGVVGGPEVRTVNVNALLGQAAWEIWHFSGYMLASG